MAKVNCRELAESFINGNISWVREQLRGNSKISLKTADIILQDYGKEDYKNFLRLMCTGG